MKIHNVSELEERLSRPSDAVVSAMKAIDGVLLEFTPLSLQFVIRSMVY